MGGDSAWFARSQRSLREPDGRWPRRGGLSPSWSSQPRMLWLQEPWGKRPGCSHTSSNRTWAQTPQASLFCRVAVHVYFATWGGADCQGSECRPGRPRGARPGSVHVRSVVWPGAVGSDSAFLAPEVLKKKTLSDRSGFLGERTEVLVSS